MRDNAVNYGFKTGGAAVVSPSEASARWGVSEGFVFALLISNVFAPPAVATALSVCYIVFYLVTRGLVVPVDVFKYLIIPAILVLIGLAGSSGHERYDVLKDGWFFTNSAMVLCAAYLAMRRIGSIDTVLKIFAVCGFAAAFIHIAEIAFDPAILLDASMRVMRQELGSGNVLALLSLSILFFSGRYGISIFKGPFRRVTAPAVMILTAASLALSFSRSFWVSFIIIAAGCAGAYTRRRLSVLLIAGVVFFAAFRAFSGYVPDDLRSRDTMAGKIITSIDEVAVSDYLSKGDIAQHWRGYESYMALQTYLDGGAWNLAMGHGLGKLVDLKIYIKLGQEEHRFIPVLHNGYLYLLVKTGLAGLMLYLLYLYMFLNAGLRLCNARDARMLFSGRLISGCALVLFFTTFVIAGFYNKTVMVPVAALLGMLLSYVKMRAARDAKAEVSE